MTVTERIASTILLVVFENPNLYLNEITQKIYEYTNERISPSTVCVVMHKHGLTRKKIQQIALQRSSTYYMEMYLCISHTC